MPGALAIAGLGLMAVGTGVSVASSAGAFNGSVDKPTPTGEEMAAAKDARATYNLGRKIQSPLDALSRQDLRYLGSDQALANAGGQSVNQYWGQLGPLGQQLHQTAARSGGPGTGAFWSQLGQGTAGLDAGVRAANMQGRLGGMNQYLARQGQFLNRRTGDLQTGLGIMSMGGAQAQQAQQARIQAQINSNIATSQAMSSIGGSIAGLGSGMMSAGMNGGGFSAGGGAGEGAGAAGAAGAGSSGLSGHYIGRYMPAYSGY